jgi:hypothetical protein
MDIYIFIFIFIFFVFVFSSMFLLFAVCAVLILLYLVSFGKLVKSMELHESELYESMGRPTTSLSVLLGGARRAPVDVKLKFYGWMLKGGKGVSHEETAALVEKTRKYLKRSLMVLVIMMLVFSTMFGTLMYVGTQAEKEQRAQAAESPTPEAG